MKLSKIVSTLMIFCLIYSTLIFSSNSAIAQEIDDNQKVRFTTIEVSDTYSKVMVEDLETGNVEYLESILEDGEFVHYVISSEGEVQHKIEGIGNDVYVDGVVFIEGSENTENSVINKNEMMTMSATKWEYLSTTSGNSSWKYAQASIIAASVATILRLHAGAALVLSIAMTFQSLDIKTVYYKKSNYVDADRTWTTCRTASNTSFYKESNYTGLITVSGLVEDYFDACAGGH